MKLNNLTIKGATGSEKVIDFGNKVAGAVVVADADAKQVADALVFAFYGSEDARFSDTEVRLYFAAEEEEYLLTRAFETDPAGSPRQTAILSSPDGKIVYADDDEGINGFVADKIGLDREGFAKLAVLDRDAVKPVLGDTVSRESFIAEMMADFATSEKVMNKYAAMKDEELKLMDGIEAVEPVTRDELKTQQIAADSDRIRLEEVRSRLEAVNHEIQLAEAYRDELNDYDAAVAKLGELNAMNAEMAAIAERAAASESATELAKVFIAYDASVKALEEKKAELRAEEDAAARRAERVKAGEGALENLGKDYMEHAIRAEEFRKALSEEISRLSENPEEFKMGGMVEARYAVFEDEKKELLERSETLSAELKELDEKSAALQDGLKEMRRSAEYKKAVQEGAVLEESLAGLNAAYESSLKLTEAEERHRSELVERKNAVNEDLRKVSAEKKKLEKEICGEFNSVEDAVNHDVYYKQTIYYKHLFVSDNEVELDAVEKKIAKVQEAAKGYSEKLETVKARSEEVKAHRTRLNEKLTLLNEKLTEYMSYNRLREITAEVEYGSHCPVCDGFVTYKKELPLRDTKALDDQIKAVEAEIAKDSDALATAELNIGQLSAAASVSKQYLDNLVAVRDDKKAAIDGVLKTYGAENIPALFALVEKAVRDSKALTHKVDRYRELTGEEKRLNEMLDTIGSEIDRIDDEKLPAARAGREELRKQISEKDRYYRDCAVYFDGEKASDLLVKLEVVDAEYETAENELDANRMRAQSVAEELASVNERLYEIINRTMLIKVGDKELSYKEVVAKAEADYLKAINEEIKNADENKEQAKARLQATRKVVDEAKAEESEGKERLLEMRAAYNAAEQAHDALYKEYVPRFDAIGLKTPSDIERIVMSDEELSAARDMLYKYDEDLVGTKEAVNVYKQSIDEHVGYYENYEANLSLRDEIKKEEEDAIMKLGASIALKADMEKRYTEVLELNKRLGYLQVRIKGIEDLSAAIKDGAILASDLAELIAERTDEIVRYTSANRYATERGADGEIVLKSTSKGRVKPDKMTKEEKMLTPLASAAAFNEIMTSLLAGDVTPMLAVSAEECDKQSLTPLVEYAKERDIVVFPDDDALFFRAVSKINI